MTGYDEGYLAGLAEAERIALSERDGFLYELRREGPWRGDPAPDEERARDLDRCMWGCETAALAIRKAIQGRKGKR